MNKGQEKQRPNKVRKLTKFMCRELLYDFATNMLDPQRHRAVEEYLKTDKDMVEELELVRNAISYCEELSQTEVDPAFLKEILASRPSFFRTLNSLSWQHWPEFLKWSAEAMAISVMVALMAIFLPWQKLQNLFPNKKVSAPIVTQSPVDIEKPVPQKIAKIEEASPAAVKPDKSKLPKTPEPTAGDKAAMATAAKTPVVAKAKEPPKTKAALKGVLYRAFMSHASVDKITADIVTKITDLGGNKAGKVELGWRKKDGSYFHMTIGEDKYELLMTYLRNFGPVRIYKDPHWRVMPEGEIRIILWVENIKK